MLRTGRLVMFFLVCNLTRGLWIVKGLARAIIPDFRKFLIFMYYRMGRNNYSYNGMLSVITRKPIYRYKARQKTVQEVVDELRESGNQRKVDSITNIISTLFSVPEVYLERNYAGPKIDLTGSSNVSMNQDATLSTISSNVA